MARKKQEVALQLEINSQEEWEELMQKEGLIVVDVFQDWCGPCKAVLSFFRRIKNEIGDDLLHFATAKCDVIDSLDKYRGRCEPCFLIYGGGSLVSVIRGANPPSLEEIIKSKLEEEHKVMKGEIERKEIKDPYISGMEVEEKVEKEDKDVEEVEQEVTLALIKPDVVKAGKVEEIISKLKERGIDILAQQERNLTEDEAKSFYHHMENSEFFENLITFITSGPSYVLVLAKGDEGIIHEFRELIGPKVFEEAMENAPDSFRAVYGTNSIENAIHGADDKESAHRELAFFFPDFIVPKISRKKQEDSQQQRTLALIRPAAFAEFRDSILEKIKAAGFKISMQKEVKLTKEDAELFYKDHAGKPYFEELTQEMSKGTLLALALEKQAAITGFRGILGPKNVEKAKENDPSSLRAQFSKEDIGINLIHGSDTEENAKNELKYFFPVEQTIAAIKPDGADNREEIINRILDARFKIVKTSDIVLSKELAEEFYADQREQEYYDDLITHLQSGPSLFMVLSREDAVRGWRSIMGPKDPNIAAESYPDSIRAIYGKDIKENAVYGSADIDEVARVMQLIFGTLEFYEDGALLPQYETHDEEVAKIEETEQQDPDSSVAHTEGQELNEPEMAAEHKTDEELDATLSESRPIESPKPAELTEPAVTQSDNIDQLNSENVEPNESHQAELITSPRSEHLAAEESDERIETSVDKVGETNEEITEGIAEPSEIVEENNDKTAIIASEENVHGSAVVEDDSTYLESLGGPMASAMNPHEEPVPLDKNDVTTTDHTSVSKLEKTETANDIEAQDQTEKVTTDEVTVSHEEDTELESEKVVTNADIETNVTDGTKDSVKVSDAHEDVENNVTDGTKDSVKISDAHEDVENNVTEEVPATVKVSDNKEEETVADDDATIANETIADKSELVVETEDTTNKVNDETVADNIPEVTPALDNTENVDTAAETAES